jgi:DNA-binding LacI/PurR family transcriptional regulator
MTSKITIYDIAKEANVSISTVSRVLTGSAPVGKTTFAKVKSVLDKYNFQPNMAARTLTKHPSMMIGVILPDITHPFYSTIFEVLQRFALQSDYSLLLYNAMNNPDLESRGLQYLQQHQVDGLIFLGGRINYANLPDYYLQELFKFTENIPTVLVNGSVDGLQAHQVYTDEAGGITQLVEYLVGLGHQEIALLGGDDNITVTAVREGAFRHAMNKAGLPIVPEWMIQGAFTIAGGMQAMETLHVLPHQPTAIIAVNDLVAIGINKYCSQHQISIPHHLSLAGFDDIYLAEVISPELTTASHNYQALGGAVIDVILKLINQQPVMEKTVIEMPLVIRDSCAPPKSPQD